MFNAFRQYEKDYMNWIQDSYPGTNVFTQDFMLENPDTLRKREAAENWCKRRGMKFVLISKER